MGLSSMKFLVSPQQHSTLRFNSQSQESERMDVVGKIAAGVIIGGLVLLGVQAVYNRHCTDIPFIGTYCAAKVAPSAFR